jgi:RimJ/RimL family protein N-acetyltransferase
VITDIPERIETRRLRLEQCVEVEAPALLDLIRSSRRQLVESFPNIAGALERVADVEAFLKDAANCWQKKTRYFYGIVEKTSFALVGQLTLKNFDWNIPACEVSYFIGERFQRRGFALEALQTLCVTAFRSMGFRRLQARVVASNTPSLLLLQKAGFCFEGRHRQAFRCGNGQLHDIDMYSRIETDWQ